MEQQLPDGSDEADIGRQVPCLSFGQYAVYSSPTLALYLAACIPPETYVQVLETMPVASTVVCFKDSDGPDIGAWLVARFAHVVFPNLLPSAAQVAMSRCTHHVVLSNTVSETALQAARLLHAPLRPVSIVFDSSGTVITDTVPTISVCIPVYDMHRRGAEYLRVALRSLECQTFRDFEVIVSDQSTTTEIRDLCTRDFPGTVWLKCASSHMSASTNTNNAIDFASGLVIKPLFQDDFLQPDALAIVAKNCVHSRRTWCALKCISTDETGVPRFSPHHPRWMSDDDMFSGRNYLGSPSTVAWPAVLNVRFDPSLINLMDLEIYMAISRRLGSPAFCTDDNYVVIRQWGGSVTNTVVTSGLTSCESKYFRTKYGA